MANTNLIFPSSKDIYIEINGKKLAIAQSYKAKSSRESRYIEAFGSDEPVGTVGGRTKHIVELSRVCATNAAISDKIDFYNLSGFNVVIVRPDKKIIYSGCEWYGISETLSLNEVMLETVTIAASKRMEI